MGTSADLSDFHDKGRFGRIYISDSFPIDDGSLKLGFMTDVLLMTFVGYFKGQRKTLQIYMYFAASRHIALN